MSSRSSKKRPAESICTEAASDSAPVLTVVDTAPVGTDGITGVGMTSVSSLEVAVTDPVVPSDVQLAPLTPSIATSGLPVERPPVKRTVQSGGGVRAVRTGGAASAKVTPLAALVPAGTGLTSIRVMVDHIGTEFSFKGHGGLAGHGRPIVVHDAEGSQQTISFFGKDLDHVKDVRKGDVLEIHGLAITHKSSGKSESFGRYAAAYRSEGFIRKIPGDGFPPLQLKLTTLADIAAHRQGEGILHLLCVIEAIGDKTPYGKETVPQYKRHLEVCDEGVTLGITVFGGLVDALASVACAVPVIVTNVKVQTEGMYAGDIITTSYSSVDPVTAAQLMADPRIASLAKFASDTFGTTA